MDVGPVSGTARATVPVRRPTELQLPIRVAVTLPLFEQFVTEVGKDKVNVISLVPPGADPHDYRLTDADIVRIKDVDFFFVNGGGLDKQLQDAIEANRKERSYVIPFAANVTSPQGGGRTAEEAGDNPHLWLDPSLASVYAEIVADEFNIYDSVRQDFYNANFVSYRKRLAGLTQDISAQVQAIPLQRRKLLSFHDAFTHFARKFGLEVAGYVVSNPPDEPATGSIAQLEQVVRDAKIPAVFAEHGYDAAAINLLGSATGARVCTLYSDILDDAAGNYEEMMRANAAELVRCLGGQ